MGQSAEAERIARGRIDLLFTEAADAFDDHPERAHRYVALARRIAMKVTLPLPRRYRDRVCSSCHHLLVPGSNARVRVDEGVRTVTCKDCGHVMRHPLGDGG